MRAMARFWYLWSLSEGGLWNAATSAGKRFTERLATFVYVFKAELNSHQ